MHEGVVGTSVLLLIGRFVAALRCPVIDGDRQAMNGGPHRRARGLGGRKVRSWDVSGQKRDLCYLMQTLAWMGGDRAWSPEMVAEQLGDFDDPRVLADLGAAVELGFVVREGDGCRLTDAGWLLASEIEPTVARSTPA